jgi:hypothetical protein
MSQSLQRSARAIIDFCLQRLLQDRQRTIERRAARCAAEQRRNPLAVLASETANAPGEVSRTPAVNTRAAARWASIACAVKAGRICFGANGSGEQAGWAGPPNSLSCRRVSDTLAVCRDRLNFEYEFRRE